MRATLPASIATGLCFGALAEFFGREGTVATIFLIRASASATC
jgi:hypothetical protein